MPAPAPCSALALDVGRRRIGLAGCDPLGLTVSPLAALHRGRFADDLETLLALARQRQVRALVVGLPLSGSAEPTTQSQHCRRYGLALQRGLAERGLALPLAWVNEHSSSWEAADRFGLRGDRSGRLDSLAAALLLEQWLREGPEPQEQRRRDDPVGLATISGGVPSTAAAL
ncbi:MAG: Holliday junction resolvase RuvX [Synechococcaceae cyanobacterium]|nr:Holliday junction resolvase RuvX [Synechococcaceae cyanobacterium]